ncbi:hypothetical protein UFOVP930_6 [uncultured Caudovirales phage]|uniref:Uncharacterized protein n=1 Tax=uncultured Caudovirales phage TaxID=2100421 RepID=A0A6J5PJE2_9CAUD|nr:hypothetical protein UFOVP930_6 [uncultured Caudovirales phage]CAB4200706.1 hypothetical protein UFOVP1354_60 [uncultured Caudovirales phage]CAB5238578.1 hypothetical protein UFOVP1547_58 [uncultured Caudovirales phage]
MQIKYDFSGLNKALSQKIQIPGNSLVNVVQDAAMKVLIGTGTGEGLVQLTRKATVERIKSDMNVPVSGKIGGGSGRTITRPRLFWLSLQWLKQNGRAFSKEAVREVMSVILKMRIKSRAYIAAGWLHCARDLHEKSPYLQKKHRLTRLKARNIPMVDKAANGTAAQSFSVTYTGNKECKVTLYNTSRGGDTVGMEFVQQAIDNATADVQVYLDKKVAMDVLKQITKNGNFSYSQS